MNYKARLIKRYADKIYKAKVAYYSTDKPIMSDWQYDCLEKQLEYLCPNHPILQMVGYDISGNWKKLTQKETEELLENHESKN